MNDPLPHIPQSIRPPMVLPPFIVDQKLMQPPRSHPSQNLSSKTIDDPRSRMPPFPLPQPVYPEPPSDNSLDQGKSPQPLNGIGGWKISDDEDRDVRLEEEREDPYSTRMVGGEHRDIIIEEDREGPMSILGIGGSPVTHSGHLKVFRPGEVTE